MHELRAAVKRFFLTRRDDCNMRPEMMTRQMRRQFRRGKLSRRMKKRLKDYPELLTRRFVEWYRRPLTDAEKAAFREIDAPRPDERKPL